MEEKEKAMLDLLLDYNQPTTYEHITNMLYLMEQKNFTWDDVEDIIKRVQLQDSKNPIGNIEHYTYALARRTEPRIPETSFYGIS